MVAETGGGLGGWLDRCQLASRGQELAIPAECIKTSPVPVASIPALVGGPVLSAKETNMNGEVRARWVKPMLVRKPLGETLGGLGANLDGLNGEFPIQS